MNTRIRVTVAAATMALLVGMSACTADGARQAVESAPKAADKTVDTSKSVLALLMAADERTQKAQSAKVTASMVTADGSKGMNARGIWSWGEHSGFEMESPAAEMDMQDLVADGTITWRFVDGTYYYEVDPADDGPFKGKRWLKLDAAAIMGKKAAAQMKAASTGGMDPTQALRSIRYAKEARDLGQETVAGRSARHYQATTRLDQLKGKSSGELFRSLPASQTGGNITSITCDIWLDAQGMPVRLGQKVGKMRMDFTFEEFGRVRPVLAPPASQTADLRSMLSNSAEHAD
ncbi:hypothetical protein ABT160_41975 [Streptomyces sp. NPDC001941]|uniref:hypothetical protein n=1 Tax=Streptomyces sp. NPDC001941 TaxID=3154659 RepID=UPI0033286433